MKKGRNKINFHIHSTGSDGKMTPEEVVKEAIAAGIHYMCFTDHYNQPAHVDPDWNTEEFHSLEYVKEIRRLQKKYQGIIDISFGAEFDWLEKYQNWIKAEIAKKDYDYALGSIHLLWINGRYYSLDNGRDGKQEWLDVAGLFGGVKNLVKEYYRQIRLLAKSELYDCVGHLDLVKMYNSKGDLFSEKESWYQEEIKQTLDEIKNANMAIEINTRGLVKVTAVQYPSFWILKEAKKRDIPLTIGTDAHSPNDLNLELEKAYKLAKRAGYKEIVIFKSRKKINIPLEK